MALLGIDLEEMPEGTRPDHATAASWREVYAEFMMTISTDPTLSAVVGLSESLTGCATVVTDAEGAVLTSSPGYTGEANISPPPIVEVLEGKKWIGRSAVATPITAPGRYFVWLLDAADAADPRHRAALRVAAELTQLLKTFSLPGIPSTWLDKGHLAERILRGDDPDRIRSDARRLGYDIDQRSYVVVVVPPSSIPSSRLAMMIGPRVRHYGLLTTRQGRFAIVVFGERDLKNLLDVLVGINDVGPFHVGVSGAQGDGTDLRRAHEQAVSVTDREAIDSVQITRFEEQDPITVLTHLADRDTVDLFISRSLGPLLDYEGAHRHDLLVTLCKWLDWTGSLDSLAEHLHIHKSTLTYRIRRIKELLGDDLVDGKDRFELGLALRLLGQRTAAGDDPFPAAG